MKPFNNYYAVKTDDTYLENVQHGSAHYPFAYYLEDIWQFDLHCISWHWHPELEFVYVTKGKATCYIGADKIELQSGYGMFINSGIIHRFEATETVIFPNIVFSPLLLSPAQSHIYQKYISPVIHSSITYQVFSPYTEWQHKVMQILKHIFYIQENNANPELETIQSLYQIWQLLYQHCKDTSSPSSRHYKTSQQSKLHIMIQFIHTHFQEQISLDDIAASVSVSKNNALCIFKKGICTSPVSYLIEYRLAQAAKLLSSTEKTISVIADECGFTSPGYFCRKFKEHYNITPNRYRTENYPPVQLDNF